MKKAFTLIELLVVITIIAFVAAIAFPVLAKASKRARRSECVGNLRQLSLAVNCYLSDWDDRYPWVYENYVAYIDHRPALPSVMKSYVPDSRLWACPNDSGEIFPKDPSGLKGRTKPLFLLQSSSYEYPGLGFPYSLAGVQTGRLTHSSSVVLLCEIRPWHGDYDSSLRDRSLSPALYNTIYCDGHSEGRTERQLLQDFDWISQ